MAHHTAGVFLCICMLPHSWNICTQQFDPKLVVCTKTEILKDIFCLKFEIKLLFFFFLTSASGPVNPLFKREHFSFSLFTLFFQPPLPYSVRPSIRPFIHSFILPSFFDLHPVSFLLLSFSTVSTWLRCVSSKHSAHVRLFDLEIA